MNMKKFFIFWLMAFVMCININAEKVVGHYHQLLTKYYIEAYTSKNDLVVIIQVGSNYKNGDVFIVIDGVKNIQNFIDALNVCKTKYIEWSKVAKSNNITNFRKPINVKFPDVEILWYDNKAHLSNKENLIKPEFSVGENFSFLNIGGIAKPWNIFFYMSFVQNDIDELISALNVDNIHSILNQETETNKLFQ